MPAGGGDLASLYYPTYSYVSSQIQSGTISLWNPYIFSGMPLAADVQTGLFYPFNWPIFLFAQVGGMYGALEWLLILHYWLASVFTYLFLRDIGLSRLGALAGAVVFAFCGFMTAHLGHLPMILVATWIPLMLLLVRRAMLKETIAGWAWAVGAGLCMAVAIFAGHLRDIRLWVDCIRSTLAIFTVGKEAAQSQGCRAMGGERRFDARAGAGYRCGTTSAECGYEQPFISRQGQL